jgi:hypothetical protein
MTHNTDAEILAGIDAAIAAGTMEIYSAPTVRVVRVRFMEDDIHDGDFPRDDIREDVFDWDVTTDPREEIIDGAVAILQREGLTFAATGNEYAANPDGSRIIDYAAGQREETSAHFIGFTVEMLAEVMERVG